MTDRMDVFEVIAQKGLSQKQVADALGISQPRLTRLKTGEYRWRAREMQAVADLLGVPVDQLYFEATWLE